MNAQAHLNFLGAQIILLVLSCGGSMSPNNVYDSDNKLKWDSNTSSVTFQNTCLFSGICELH